MMIPHSPLDSFAAAEASRNAAEAATRADRASREVHELSARLDRLTLLSESLWSLLKERTDLTELDLVKRVSETELQRNQAPKIDCPNCHHLMAARRRRCIYCGHSEPLENLFQSV